MENIEFECPNCGYGAFDDVGFNEPKYECTNCGTIVDEDGKEIKDDEDI